MALDYCSTGFLCAWPLSACVRCTCMCDTARGNDRVQLYHLRKHTCTPSAMYIDMGLKLERHKLDLDLLNTFRRTRRVHWACRSSAPIWSATVAGSRGTKSCPEKTLANTTVSIQRGTDHCNAVYLDWHRRIQPRSELHSFKKAHVNTERERERKYTLICLLKARSFTDVNILTFALASESTWRHLPNKNAHQYTRAHIFIFIYAHAGTRANI